MSILKPQRKKASITKINLQRLNRIIYPLGSILVLLILWTGAVRIFNIGPYLLPSPKAIFFEFIDKRALLLQHSIATLRETLAGFFLAVTIGITLGLLIFYWPLFKKTIYPLIIASQTIPETAIAPLLLIWLGFGILPKIVIAFLVAVFPVIINTVIGMSSIESDMIRLARSMGANEFRVFWKIRMPYALPTMFAGIKVATTLAIVGAIVGEFVGSDSGLGYLLVRTISMVNTRLMFSAIICSGIMGTLLFSVVQMIESLVIPWHISKRR